MKITVTYRQSNFAPNSDTLSVEWVSQLDQYKKEVTIEEVANLKFPNIMVEKAYEGKAKSAVLNTNFNTMYIPVVQVEMNTVSSYVLADFSFPKNEKEFSIFEKELDKFIRNSYQNSQYEEVEYQQFEKVGGGISDW
jgi:hypothetical protein